MTLVRPIVRSIVRGIVRGDALDADAAAFIAATGATDVEAIDAWVRGIKDLGLWDNMVCWPLRSSQNFGTGTTVRSLGGLAQANGTMVNGPTWGGTGIDFDAASTQHIATNYRFPSGPFWAFADILATDISSNCVVISKDDLNTFRDWNIFFSTLTNRFRLDANVGAGIGNRISLPNSNTTARQVIQFSHSDNTYRGRRNAESDQSSTSGATGTIVNTSSDVFIGVFSNATQSPFQGTIGMAALFSAPSTAQLKLDLYDLYKSTLGQGLGLP